MSSLAKQVSSTSLDKNSTVNIIFSLVKRESEPVSKKYEDKKAGEDAEDVPVDLKNVFTSDNEKTQSSIMAGMRLYVCLFALVLAQLIVALDVFIVNTVIDVVSKNLGGYAKSGWLITGYSLPNSLLSLIWGRATSLLGFQSSMLISIFIFEVGSIVSATATSMNNLVVGRVVAGIGGSGLQTVSMIIGCSLVEERNRTIVIAVIMSAFAVSSLIGPFIGGAFTTHATWRWCFWISLPVGGSAAFLFFFTYNPERLSITARLVRCLKLVKAIPLKQFQYVETYKTIVRNLVFRFDLIGFTLNCTGICLFLLGLTFGSEDNSWKRAFVVCFLVIGGLLVVCSVVYDFYIFDRINPEPANASYRPLMVRTLIGHKYVLLANTVTCAAAVVFAGYMVYSVQFFQLVLGYTAWNAGLHLIPLVIASLLSAIFCGGFTKKTGHVKYVMIANIALLLIGSGVCTLLDNYSNNSMQIDVWILPGFGLGATLQCALISSQLQIDKNSPDAKTELVEITAFNSFCKSLGSSIGAVLSTTTFISALWRKINKAKLEGYYGKKINELVKYRLQNFDGKSTEAAEIFSAAVTYVFWMCYAFSALAFFCACLSSNRKVETEKKVAQEEHDGLPSIPEFKQGTTV